MKFLHQKIRIDKKKANFLGLLEENYQAAKGNIASWQFASRPGGSTRILRGSREGRVTRQRIFSRDEATL